MALALGRLPLELLTRSELAETVLRERPYPAALDGLCVPRDLSEIPEPLSSVDRVALSASLRASLVPLAPPAAVLAALDKLALPNACVVVAGQQPALLGGPLYNLYKAVHAVVLARHLERAWSRPVVALFWNHADDHDWAEVHHSWLVNENFDLRKLGLAGISSSRQPIGRLLLDEPHHQLAALASALSTLLPENAERAQLLELALPRSGETLARAFTRWWTALLGPLGLVVLEPEAWRVPLSNALAALLEAPAALAALQQGTQRLREQGFTPAIETQGAALLFEHDSGGRRAVRLQQAALLLDGEERAREPRALAALVRAQPANYSAGALLRPLVQDRALPVAAYVGGWGELGYHAQLPALRRAAAVPLTPFVPRFSAVLVSRETRASLATLETSLAAALASRGTLAETAAENSAAAPLAKRLRETSRAASELLLELRADLTQLDAGLGVQLKQTAEQCRGLVERLAEKAERVAANNSGKGKRHYRRVNGLLCPRGEAQERVLSALQAVAWHGRGWLSELALALEPLPAEPLALELDPS